MLYQPSFAARMYARRNDYERVQGRRTKVAWFKDGRSKLESNDTFPIACCEGNIEPLFAESITVSQLIYCISVRAQIFMR